MKRKPRGAFACGLKKCGDDYLRDLLSMLESGGCPSFIVDKVRAEIVSRGRCEPYLLCRAYRNNAR